jgi:hypothetical protein
MSHFTYIKTQFQNIIYLEKALQKLNLTKIKHERIKNSLNSIDLVIPQSNGYDIKFIWNNHEYELMTDISFWSQSQSIETFIDNVGQQYACELIIGESQKMDFQPVDDQQEINGSTTLVLQRWNNL